MYPLYGYFNCRIEIAINSMSEVKVKTHIVLPKGLMEEIRKVTGSKKRSEFLVEAAREKLKRVQLDKAIERAAGLWTKERYPEFTTEQEVREKIHSSRVAAGKRLKSKLHGHKISS